MLTCFVIAGLIKSVWLPVSHYHGCCCANLALLPGRLRPKDTALPAHLLPFAINLFAAFAPASPGLAQPWFCRKNITFNKALLGRYCCASHFVLHVV